MVLALIFAFALAGSCAVNLAPNPSFEEIDKDRPYNNGYQRPIGWGTIQGAHVSEAFGSVDTHSRTGERSLFLGPLTQSGGRTYWRTFPSLKVKPGATYRAIVYVMAENTEKTDGTFAVTADFDLVFRWIDSGGKITTVSSERYKLRSETDWIEYTFEAVAPEDAVTVDAGFSRRWISGPAGNLYFDDYELICDLGMNLIFKL